MTSFHTEDGLGVPAVTAQQMRDVDRVAVTACQPDGRNGERRASELWPLHCDSDRPLLGELDHGNDRPSVESPGGRSGGRAVGRRSPRQVRVAMVEMVSAP